MKRRNFLHGTLTALAIPGITVPAYPRYLPPKKAFKVNSLETRYKEKIIITGAPIDFKLLSNDTEDRLSVFISTNNRKGFGPPLHLHHSFDEFFCVLEGEFLFQLDDEVLSLNNGDTLFIPREVKHCFNYNGKTSGTLLVGISPAKGMEKYFSEMGKLLTTQGIPDMAAIHELFKSYDSELLGPPMK
ncbi:MAG: cupin domain-containing protein [Chitinophagaceae bacterium]|nr:cupin domain-containing protein [Chitinophagaceae bacterium]